MTIAIVTGSRADRGPLIPVQKALQGVWIQVDPSPARVPTDSVISCSASMLAAMTQYEFVQPDLVLLLGDRYEILGAAMAAHLLNLPLAHLSGGDITEGSQDNSMRHAISKLAHLHFTTHQQSSDYLIHELGEEAWRVYTVGCPGIDNLENTQLYNKRETLELIGKNGSYFLVNYQPATLAIDPLGEAKELIKALVALNKPCVFASVNADFGGRAIEELFAESCVKHGWSMIEMDSQLFLSALRHCDMMIGNSSSGFYEAPSFRKPFVNVGDRQKGRIAAASIISCEGATSSIIGAVKAASELDCRAVVNPYGDGRAAERIRNILDKLQITRGKLLTKCITEHGKCVSPSFVTQELMLHTSSRSLH